MTFYSKFKTLNQNLTQFNKKKHLSSQTSASNQSYSLLLLTLNYEKVSPLKSTPQKYNNFIK